MQSRLRQTIRAPSRKRRQEDQEAIEAAHERLSNVPLYPAYGVVYTLARRESVLYPALLRVGQFVILSTILCIAAVIFVTPISLFGMKICSLNLMPVWILIAPAIVVALLVAAVVLFFCMAAFKHSIDQVIASDVAAHENVPIEREVLEQAPNHWFETIIWIAAFPLNFIPIIGIPLFFWVHGLTKAYSLAQARTAAEPDWSSTQKRTFRWKGVWQLQSAGFIMAILEALPVVGPLLHFTDLVSRALYVADGVRTGKSTP